MRKNERPTLMEFVFLILVCTLSLLNVFNYVFLFILFYLYIESGE